MKTRHKRIARPKRSASRQRFRIKAPRLPKLEVPSRQQRELAGIACFLLAGLLVLAVAVQTGGSAMHFLHGGLVGLFGWGVVFVILAAVAAGVELLAPWIEVMTWGRGLGIALLLISALGLLHLSAGQSGGSVGQLEGEALRSLAGTAGSILILVALLLGSLVLAFDISLREAVAALREHYVAARPRAKGKRGGESGRTLASAQPGGAIGDLRAGPGPNPGHGGCAGPDCPATDRTRADPAHGGGKAGPTTQAGRDAGTDPRRGPGSRGPADRRRRGRDPSCLDQTRLEPARHRGRPQRPAA